MKFDDLCQEWLRVWLDKDVARIDRMMAPGYMYIAPNGQVADRQAILGVIRSPTYKLVRGTRSEMKVIELAPAVTAVIHRTRDAGTFQGRTFDEDHRCLTIFVKHGRDWLVALEQCSNIG